MKASDNPYPSVLLEETAAPASPAAGHQRLFIDPVDHSLKVKKSDGTVAGIGGGVGASAMMTVHSDPFPGDGQGWGLASNADGSLMAVAGDPNVPTKDLVTRCLALSTDRGQTWHYPPVDPFNGAVNTDMTALAVAITATGRIIVGGQASDPTGVTGVSYAYSDDLGATWTYPEVALGHIVLDENPAAHGAVPSQSIIQGLLVAGTTIVMYGYGASALAVSTDNGATFQTAATDPFGGSSAAVNFHGVYNVKVIGTRIHAVGCPGDGSGKTYAYSDDDGVTWVTPAAGDPLYNDIHTTGMGLDGIAGFLVMTAAEEFGGAGHNLPHSVAFSADEGLTWTTATTDPYTAVSSGGGLSCVVVLDATHAVFGGYGGGLAETHDGGVTITETNASSPEPSPKGMAANSAGVVVATDNYNGPTIYVSTDRGLTWTPVITSSGGLYYVLTNGVDFVTTGYAGITDPVSGGNTGATTAASTDGGLTWSRGFNHPMDFWAMAVPVSFA